MIKATGVKFDTEFSTEPRCASQLIYVLNLPRQVRHVLFSALNLRCQLRCPESTMSTKVCPESIMSSQACLVFCPESTISSQACLVLCPKSTMSSEACILLWPEYTSRS